MDIKCLAQDSDGAIINVAVSSYPSPVTAPEKRVVVEGADFRVSFRADRLVDAIRAVLGREELARIIGSLDERDARDAAGGRQ